MIEIAIEKRLGSFSLDASFSAGSGVTALFGRSGSGKSTIVKAIAGLVRPDRGRIRVGDRVLFDAGTDLPAERRRAGVVFQDGRLFPHMSVEDNLMYGYTRADGSRPIDKAAVVDVLGLGALLARRPQTLSGGERQRVAIGRALLAQPSVLLMDEPLASLDDARKREVLPYLGSLNERFRIPIIYVTHDADEVLSLANDLVLLANGRVVASGTLGDVTSRLDLPADAEALGLGAVLDGRIEAHDPSRGLTTIATAAGALRLPLMEREAGAHVAVRIAARDVAISLAPVDGISVQNILPVTVGEIAQPSAHVARLALKAGAATVLAEITNDARVRLELAPGTKAFALIKSVALARHS